MSRKPGKRASKWTHPGPAKDPELTPTPDADPGNVKPPVHPGGRPRLPEITDAEWQRELQNLEVANAEPQKPPRGQGRWDPQQRQSPEEREARRAARSKKYFAERQAREKAYIEEKAARMAAQKRSISSTAEAEQSPQWTVGNNLDWLAKAEPPAKTFHRWKRRFDKEQKGKEFDPAYLAEGKWIPIFLVVLEKTGSQWKAIDESRITMQALQARKDSDPKFENAFREAGSRFYDMLYREYVRRAVIGNPKYATHNGERKAIIKMEKDGDALATLVKAYFPELRVTPDKDGDESTGQAVGEALRSFLGIDESGKTVDGALEGQIRVLEHATNGQASDADD